VDRLAHGSDRRDEGDSGSRPIDEDLASYLCSDHVNRDFSDMGISSASQICFESRKYMNPFSGGCEYLLVFLQSQDGSIDMKGEYRTFA